MDKLTLASINAKIAAMFPRPAPTTPRPSHYVEPTGKNPPPCEYCAMTDNAQQRESCSCKRQLTTWDNENGFR